MQHRRIPVARCVVNTTASVALIILLAFRASPVAAQADASDVVHKSEAGALAWSLAGTLAPIGAGLLIAVSSGGWVSGGTAALAVGGFVVGPALGHFYADRVGRGFVGIGVRALAILTLVGLRCGFTEASCTYPPGFAYVGIAAGTISMFYDIATAPASARWYNDRHKSVSVRTVPVPWERRVEVATTIRF